MRRLGPTRCQAGFQGIACLALALALVPSRNALAYPYEALRPAEQVIGGPTDGYLSALHYNPAGLRLFPGSQLLAVGGVRGSFGGYRRNTPLPSGYAPGSTTAQNPDQTRIGWATSDMMVAGSWDLRTEAVTLGLGVYTPSNDETLYADGDPRGEGAQKLAGRYHVIADRTYSVRGTVAVGLRLRPWFYAGAGFQFAYTHSRMRFLRDMDPQLRDNLPCASPTACEQWSNRQLIDFDVSGWGYGFTAGVLFEPIDNKLWLGVSYVSPLFSSQGAEVGLDGAPQRLPWQGADQISACGEGGTGVRSARGEEPTICGVAHMARSFPHLAYFGARGRITISPAPPVLSDDGSFTEAAPSSRFSPYAIDLTGWIRLNVPTREVLLLSMEPRIYGPGQLTLQTAQRPAVALTFGVRQLWRSLILAQEVLYESSRTDSSAVSPGNLESHKLDLSLAARIKLQKRLWLLVTVGLTGYIFSSDAGSGFSSDYVAACRATDYDVNTDACRNVQNGWGIPTAAGAYWMLVPHGATGLELNL